MRPAIPHMGEPILHQEWSFPKVRAGKLYLRRLRIENDRLEVSGTRVRRTATVTWEEAPRPPVELCFETDASRTGDLSESFDAFLLASAVAASRHGEKRIRVEGRLCPRLVEGVRTALAILRDWYPEKRALPALEAAGGLTPASRGRRRAALWLTAGVDSLHILRENRRMYPSSHPQSFRRAIYAPHLNFADGAELPRARDLARRQIAAVRAAAGETDTELVVVDSNQRLLEPGIGFPGREALASLLAATAHFQAAGIASCTIAASFDLSELMPWGSHPLLDTRYGSAGLEIHHEGWGRTRLEKIQSLAAWPPFRHLFVCFEGPLADGESNCGRCEKCLRTMTALVAARAPGKHPAFAAGEVSPGMILEVDAGYHPELFELNWAPLAAPAADAGREDLARAIRRRVDRARRDLAGAHRHWRRLARRWDARATGGVALRVWRRLRSAFPGARR
jgi:hypothetical protein